MRYVVDFGSANVGGSPTWMYFKSLDTGAALAQPTITEDEDGSYYFDVDWSTTTATSISFKVTLNAIELSDVISSPGLAVQGVSTAAAGVSSLIGYEQVGPIVGRAAVECGIDSMTASEIASFDPFASSDQSVIQMLRHLDALGRSLSSILKPHLHREFSLTTAGSASSYALPADYAEMVDDTLWNRPGLLPLYGPVSAQTEQAMKARNAASTISTPFRVLGNRITFPVVPADGLTFYGVYVSRYWVQTLASGTGPDADHVTARTDYVLFDPELMVLGLKLRFLTAKGFDTSIAASDYRFRLDHVRGIVSGGGVLSLDGRGYEERFLDGHNLPVTNWGA